MTGARPAGFTLIEVLVGLVVFSIGLLATASLLLATMRYSDSAYLRSQAVLSAYAIVDRMRANREAAVAGDYDIALSALSDLSTPDTGIAAIDRYDWFQDLDDSLPGAKGAIDCTAGAVCTVTVQWDDSRAEGTSDVKQQTLAAQL